MGVVLVTGLWLMFGDDNSGVKENGSEGRIDTEKTTDPVERVPETPPGRVPETPSERDEKKPEEIASSTDPGEESAGGPGDETTIPDIEPPAEKPPDSELETKADETPPDGETETAAEGGGEEPPSDPEDVDQGPGETETAGASSETAPSPDVLSDADSRQDFWQPFTTRKKAEKFGEYIKAVSGVDCQVRKISPVRHQVYFTYEDEPDRKSKIAMIEDAGVKLDLDGAPSDEKQHADAMSEAAPPQVGDDIEMPKDSRAIAKTGDEERSSDGEPVDDVAETGESVVSDPGQEPLQTPVSSNQMQQDIWKPFNAKGKAKGFAAHITSMSGVDCQVKKTGPGRHQVYFVYDDELDRKAKIAMIEEAGVTLDLAQ